MNRPTRLITLFLLAALTGACDQRSTRIEHRDEDLQALLAGSSLAASTRPGLLRAPPLARVWILSTGIRVDDLALWRGLSLEELDTLASHTEPTSQPVDETKVKLTDYALPPGATRDPGGYFVEDLFDSLAQVQENSRRIASLRQHPFQGRVLVVVDPQAPFQLVSRVLYTLGQAQFGEYRFAVRSPTGVRVIASSAPRICATSCPDPFPFKPCQGISVLISRAGLAWTPRMADESPCKRVARGKADLSEITDEQRQALAKVFEDVKGVPLPPPTGKSALTLIREELACPSTPRRSGALDLTTLKSALAERPAAPEPCQIAMLGALDPIPWQELVTVADALAQQGHPEFMLFVGLAGDGCP